MSAFPENPFHFEREVDFCDTDAAGIGHFSLYFRLMEAGEAALFKRLGLDLLSSGPQGQGGFPRVSVECRFRRPLYFGDRVRTRLSAQLEENRRIAYSFVFYRLGAEGLEERSALGSMVTAFARKLPDGGLQGGPMPSEILEPLLAWSRT